MKTVTILLSLFLSLSLHAAELTVHAAASLTDAMKQIASAYEKQSGDKLRLNFDASSILVRQIEEGAPADVFLSADELKMDELEKKGLLAPDTRKTLLSNTLVVVIPADSSLTIKGASDLTKEDVKKIAVSQPESVPVGVYTKMYLTKMGLWDKIVPKVVPTQNVRASLAAVESGNVEAGFVYKTDALISKKVKIVWEIPKSEGPKISYPVAALKGSANPAEAGKLLHYLESEPALAVFRQLGFSVAE